MLKQLTRLLADIPILFATPGLQLYSIFSTSWGKDQWNRRSGCSACGLKSSKRGDQLWCGKVQLTTATPKNWFSCDGELSCWVQFTCRRRSSTWMAKMWCQMSIPCWMLSRPWEKFAPPSPAASHNLFGIILCIHHLHETLSFCSCIHLQLFTWMFTL